MLAYRFCPPGEAPLLFDIAPPFKALILIERDVTPDLRMEVSRALVAAGCRYTLAWGRACSLWDDAVDLADRERFGGAEIPDDRFVMTTWHEGATLADVMWSARHVATETYDGQPLDRLLVLDLGDAPREAAIRALHDAAVAEGLRASGGGRQKGQPPSQRRVMLIQTGARRGARGERTE